MRLLFRVFTWDRVEWCTVSVLCTLTSRFVAHMCQLFRYSQDHSCYNNIRRENKKQRQNCHSIQWAENQWDKDNLIIFTQIKKKSRTNSSFIAVKLKNLYLEWTWMKSRHSELTLRDRRKKIAYRILSIKLSAYSLKRTAEGHNQKHPALAFFTEYNLPEN